MSANLTDKKELDASIIFRDDPKKIAEFNCQFDRLLQLFVTPDGTSDGILRRLIVAAAPDVPKIFDLPKNIGMQHKDHWITHYPVELCPESVPIREKLFIAPFDCRGYNFVSSVIIDANEYAYISTESFTDENFSNFLVNISVNKKTEIKILSGVTSMDFSDRIADMFRDLLAQNIAIRATKEELHAKLIVTDKVLVVSSINLNKINLGFHPTLPFWRENTETLFVSKDPVLIASAKEKYLEVFNGSQNVNDLLAEKLEDLVKDIFKGCFQLSPNPEVRMLFAKFILRKQIDAKRTIIKIGAITRKLMTCHGSRVKRDDFVTAMVLYYLSERKRDYAELKERMDELGTFNIQQILTNLTMAGTVEKDEDSYYKINVAALSF